MTTVLKSSLKGKGTTSFKDCESSFRTCQDIVLQKDKKWIEGDKERTPCEQWLNDWDGTPKTKPKDLPADAVAECEFHEAWSMNNRTIRLGPDQACRFKVASQYEEAVGEKTWLPGFDFGENEDDGVLVIVKDQWVDADSNKEFWTAENARADTGGWYLLQGKVNGTVLSPGGRVPIGRNKKAGKRQEWHVILINKRDSKDKSPSNKELKAHADRLKKWEEEFAKATLDDNKETQEKLLSEKNDRLGKLPEGTTDAYINIRYGNAASLAVSVVSSVLGFLILA